MTAGDRSRAAQPAGRGSRRWAVVAVLAVGLTLFPFSGGADAVGPTCTTSGPTGGAYSVDLCIAVSGTTPDVSGDVTVTGTVAITPSSAASVAKLEFSLDGVYLLTDFESPYTFVLPTAKFVDGTKPLAVVAILRDGYVTPANSVSLNFSNGITSPPVNTNTFTPTPGTSPSPGAPFVLAAAGDGASGRVQADDVVSLINSWNPNLFAYLGDVYERGTSTEFRNWYGSAGTRWGTLRSRTNPVIGNHEYENGVAPGYFDHWDNVPNYYSYNSHGWHFIALNSTSQFNQSTPGSAQYEWLLADLRANTSACTVAYFHHPLLNVGPEGSIADRFDPMWKLMSDNGVDVVLTGHDHNYQRWAPVDRSYQPTANGITQFVAGAGGQGVRSFVTTDPRLVVGYDTSPQALGALRFELNAAGASFTYQNTAGATLDHGVIPCNGAGTDSQAPSKPPGLTGDAVTGPAVELHWQASTDNVGVSTYRVLRNGSPIATVDGYLTNFTDTSVAPSSTSTYSVVAVDPAGNLSAPSDPVSVTVGGIPPEVPAPIVADTYVNDAAPTTSYGSSTVLRVDGSPIQQTYLRAQVTGLVGSVVSAKLRIYANASHSAGFVVQDVTDDTWSESTLTYNTAPSFGPTIGTSGKLTAGSYVDIPVTGVTGNGTYSFALTALNNTGINLASRESLYAPELVVTQQVTANLPPVANDLTVATNQDQSTTWTPAVSDPDSGSLTCTIGTSPASGIATVASDCSTGSYTPSPGFHGPDTFTYIVSDGVSSDAGTVSVTVNATGPTLVTVPVNADTYVSSSKPKSTYGSASQLQVDSSPVQRTYLRAQVSGLVGTVVSAKLLVYANASHSAGFVVQTVADNSWSESAMNYLNAPSVGPSIGSSGGLTKGRYVEITVAGVVTGNGTFSFALTPLNSSVVKLASRETAHPPQLQLSVL